MEKPKILIIEDNESIRTQMKWALAVDYDVLAAEDRKAGLGLFSKAKPCIVTLDLGLPPDSDGVEEGFTALAQIQAIDPIAKVIVITGRQEKEHALHAIDQGAYDFFLKPVEIEELKVVLRRALHVRRLEEENRRLQSECRPDAFANMLGSSPQMQEVFSKIRKVAPTDVAVLITGESGTGKELAARAIHNLSSRKDGPFVAINCGAIPENLLESELFGHEKGAFTGAHAQKKGQIELANAGTLFLDEIGELPLALQVKLLRFLQDQKFMRVGGRVYITANVRVVSATNVDIRNAIAEGRLREDLFYRIGGFGINMPPLREREGDILYLAKTFLMQYGLGHQKRVRDFTRQAVRVLLAHPWSGNVRELENCIKRAVIMAEGTNITPEDLELLDRDSHIPSDVDLKTARENLEREMIERALARHAGNISKSAMELGISRPTLYEMLEKLAINRR